jgi:hypothetical protein
MYPSIIPLAITDDNLLILRISLYPGFKTPIVPSPIPMVFTLEVPPNLCRAMASNYLKASCEGMPVQSSFCILRGIEQFTLDWRR